MFRLNNQITLNKQQEKEFKIGKEKMIDDRKKKEHDLQLRITELQSKEKELLATKQNYKTSMSHLHKNYAFLDRQEWTRKLTAFITFAFVLLSVLVYFSDSGLWESFVV